MHSARLKLEEQECVRVARSQRPTLRVLPLVERPSMRRRFGQTLGLGLLLSYTAACSLAFGYSIVGPWLASLIAG